MWLAAAKKLKGQSFSKEETTKISPEMFANLVINNKKAPTAVLASKGFSNKYQVSSYELINSLLKFWCGSVFGVKSQQHCGSSNPGYSSAITNHQQFCYSQATARSEEMELPGAETRCSKTRYFLMEELTFYTYDSTDRISHPHNPVNGPTVSQLISTIKKNKKNWHFYFPNPARQVKLLLLLYRVVKKEKHGKSCEKREINYIRNENDKGLKDC